MRAWLAPWIITSVKIKKLDTDQHMKYQHIKRKLENLVKIHLDYI